MGSGVRDWYDAVDPATGKPFPGPCSRCKSLGCHPAVYERGGLPVCFECLTFEEQLLVSLGEDTLVDELLREAGV